MEMNICKCAEKDAVIKVICRLCGDEGTVINGKSFMACRSKNIDGTLCGGERRHYHMIDDCYNTTFEGNPNIE